MGILATTYSVAALVMFMICATARIISPNADRIARAASWVVLFTGLSRLVGYYTDPPLSVIHYAPIDLFLMILSFGWWQVRGERWAWWLGLCFLSQLVLHGWFWWEADPRNLYLYLTLNNGHFLATLLILTFAGGGYVARWLHDRLRLPRRRLRGFLAHREAS